MVSEYRDPNKTEGNNQIRPLTGDENGVNANTIIKALLDGEITPVGVVDLEDGTVGLKFIQVDENGEAFGSADSPVYSIGILPNTIISGEVDVTVPGTPVPLSETSVPVRKIYLKAKRANTGYISIGDDDTNAAEATEQGYSLEAEEPFIIEFADLKDIYLDGTIAGEGASFTATKLVTA